MTTTAVKLSYVTAEKCCASIYISTFCPVRHYRCHQLMSFALSGPHQHFIGLYLWWGRLSKLVKWYFCQLQIPELHSSHYVPQDSALLYPHKGIQMVSITHIVSVNVFDLPSNILNSFFFASVYCRLALYSLTRCVEYAVMRSVCHFPSNYIKTAFILNWLFIIHIATNVLL